MKKVIMLALVICGVQSYTASAHHAFAQEFSVDLPVDLNGIVTKVELINPHSWIHIAVTNAEGVEESWMVEGGSPNSLFRQGITKDSIPIGAELDVFGYQARDRTLKAVGRDISFADGTPLFFRGTRVPE
ncbi:MAG: DUF6152 family protein [Gammaproteobacteria bacterium]|nr:DUF6152 family protein [Gammaproteobacteria bacterium]